MKLTPRNAFWLLAGGLYLFLLGIFVSVLERLFLKCPYPDFLSWDGNLRFITTLRMMDAFRSGEWFSFLVQVFDAPTWPILRNLFQMVSFFLWEPNGMVDTNLTLFTYLILCICLPFIYYRLNPQKKNLTPLISSFLTLVLLFHSDTILLYVFSPMLEIQGSLFTILFLISYYQFLIKKISITIPSLFGFLCYQTKYPYGYILIFYIVIFFTCISWKESLSHLKELFPFLLNKSVKIYFFLVLIFFGISYVFKDHLPGKAPFYLNYLSILILSFLSVKYILLINKKHSSPFTQSLSYIVLPILIFTILHPDRVGSSAGTIQHIQSEGKIVGELIEKDLYYYLSFFITLYRDLWDDSYLGFFFFSLQIISLVNGLILFIQKKKIFSPSFIFSSFILISILGLTFLTPNHQARHVFHLYPSVLLSGFLFLNEKSFFQKLVAHIFHRLFPLNHDTPVSKSRQSAFRMFYYWGGLLLLGIFYVISSPGKLNIWNRSPHLCFGGKIPIYDAPLFFQKELKDHLNHNSVLLNQMDPLHLNKVDTELVFAKAAYDQNKKVALNLREYWRNPNTFSTIILAGTQCAYNLEELEERFLTKLEFQSEKRTEKGCLIFLAKQNPPNFLQNFQ